MQSETLETIFDGLSSKLQAEFDFLSSQFKNRLSAGEAREYVLKELLRNYLPQKLGVGSGMVIDSRGAKSRQIDIVIYDALNTPVMYAADNLQIFPVECVYAVIEVKSHLNSSELKKSLVNIRTVKSMSKTAYVPDDDSDIKHPVYLYGQTLDHFPVLGIVFAYSSIKNIKILKDKLVETDDTSNSINNIDMVCILNKACITNWIEDEDKIILTKEPSSKRVSILTPKSLLMFYLQSTHILLQTRMRPIQLTQYAQNIHFGMRGE